MYCDYACGSPEHHLHRRQFLGSIAAAGIGAATGGLGVMASPAAAKKLASDQKRVLLFFLHGGVSQLETWDPKPGVATGGPFSAIKTSVPGLHISELLPYTAKQMHHLAVVRSVNSNENEHNRATYRMVTGRATTAGVSDPEIGAVMARALEPEHSSMPGHISLSAGGSGGRGGGASYLGPKYAAYSIGNGNPPKFSVRPDDITASADAHRNQFRRLINDRFALRRRSAQTDAYTQTYEQARELMKQGEVFDVSKEPQRDHERYGTEEFGRMCLLARRLLENNITFVKVGHSNYDTHHENFNFHIEQMGDFDRPFATLVDDLHQRGMLESTLIIVMSEFGRTPRINPRYGRDHWSKSWSVVLGGCGIHAGAVLGKTNADGTEVVDAEVDHANLFHTYLAGVGLDPTDSFDINGRKIPMADPASHAIEELLV